MSGKNKALYAALESEKERENEDPVDTNEWVDQAFTTQGKVLHLWQVVFQTS